MIQAIRVGTTPHVDTLLPTIDAQEIRGRREVKPREPQIAALLFIAETTTRAHIGLLVLAGTAFVLSTDLTMINVALGPLQQDLHASLTELGWVVDGYSIAALMLAPGRPTGLPWVNSRLRPA